MMRRTEKNRRSNALIAGAAIAVLLFLNVLAAWPEAHEWLHPDSQQADHECAVTLYITGFTADAALLVAVWAVWRCVQRCTRKAFSAVESRRDLRLPPGRGPPAYIF